MQLSAVGRVQTRFSSMLMIDVDGWVNADAFSSFVKFALSFPDIKTSSVSGSEARLERLAIKYMPRS